MTADIGHSIVLFHVFATSMSLLFSQFHVPDVNKGNEKHYQEP